MMFVLAMEFFKGLERRLWRLRSSLTTDFGGHSGGVTPVPIPNTEVKPTSADGTWEETPWESRSPPDFSAERGPSGPRSSFSCPVHSVRYAPAMASRPASSPLGSPSSRRLAERAAPAGRVDRARAAVVRQRRPSGRLVRRVRLAGRLEPPAGPRSGRARRGAARRSRVGAGSSGVRSERRRRRGRPPTLGRAGRRRASRWPAIPSGAAWPDGAPAGSRRAAPGRRRPGARSWRRRREEAERHGPGDRVDRRVGPGRRGARRGHRRRSTRGRAGPSAGRRPSRRDRGRGRAELTRSVGADPGARGSSSAWPTPPGPSRPSATPTPPASCASSPSEAPRRRRGPRALRPHALPPGQVEAGRQGARGVPPAHRLDRAAPGAGRLLPGARRPAPAVDELWDELREASPSAELVDRGPHRGGRDRWPTGATCRGAIRLLEQGWRCPKRPQEHHLRRGLRPGRPLRAGRRRRPGPASCSAGSRAADPDFADVAQPRCAPSADPVGLSHPLGRVSRTTARRAFPQNRPAQPRARRGAASRTGEESTMHTSTRRSAVAVAVARRPSAASLPSGDRARQPTRSTVRATGRRPSRCPVVWFEPADGPMPSARATRSS